MSDIPQHIQNKTDWITGWIATAGLPAPLFTSFLDGTAKIAALIYSILGAIYMVKQLRK